MTESALTRFTKDLSAYGKQFQSVLPSHISPEKFMRTVVGAISNNQDILQCDRGTIYAACQKAAQDGLILDNREAALVKFNTKDGKVCQYMPMVGGLLKKLRNSGQLSTIRAETVHENDVFSFNPAMEEIPNHKPDWFEKDGPRGDMIGVYAVAKMKDGGVIVEIMNKTDLDKVRKVSRSGNDDKGNPKGIWKQWPEEMAKKSVLRRIAKYLPSSADIDQMFDHDNENYDLTGEDLTPPMPAKKKGQTRAADKIIEGDCTEIPPDAGPEENDTDPI